MGGLFLMDKLIDELYSMHLAMLYDNPNDVCVQDAAEFIHLAVHELIVIIVNCDICLMYKPLH